MISKAVDVGGQNAKACFFSKGFERNHLAKRRALNGRGHSSGRVIQEIWSKCGRGWG
jgi:hypothetical protein